MRYFRLILIVAIGCGVVFAGGRKPAKERDGGKPVGKKEVGVMPSSLEGNPVIFVFWLESPQALDQGLSLIETDPTQRLTVVLPPLFLGSAEAERHLREKLLHLREQGRIELALRLLGDPLLPLIEDSDSSRMNLPKYRWSEDVVQVLAQSRARFRKEWGFFPAGFVPAWGAVSVGVLESISRASFEWTVVALPTSAAGPYDFKNLHVMNGSVASIAPVGLQVRMVTSAEALQRQISHLRKDERAMLPSEALKAMGTRVLSELEVEPRTWSEPSLARWADSPARVSAWAWLSRTRQDLENFKDSGRADMQRMDTAFSEMYGAEALASQPEFPEAELKASLASIYRLMSQEPPQNLFEPFSTPTASGGTASGKHARAQSFVGGEIRVVLEDEVGDDHGSGALAYPLGSTLPSGSYDLKRLEVTTTTAAVQFDVIAGTAAAPLLVDVYMDLNHRPEAGTVSFLPGRGLWASASDAWEYALVISGGGAALFETRGLDRFEEVGRFPVEPLTAEGGRPGRASPEAGYRARVPREALRGSPERWGYQVCVMAPDPASTHGEGRPLAPPPARLAQGGPPPGAAQTEPPPPVYDLLDPSGVPQSRILQNAGSHRRVEVPFVRLEEASVP